MSPNPISARDEGLRYLKQGSLAEAIDYLTEAIEEDPKDVELYLYLGYAYAQSNEYYKAIDVFTSGIDKDFNSAKLHYNLGIAYLKVNNLTMARDEYMKALGIDASYTAAKTALDKVIDLMDKDGMSGSVSV